MKFESLNNGALRIAIEDDADTELVADLLVRHGGNDVGLMADLLEQTGWTPNGALHLVSPEDIGALTDAPILTDELHLHDDGKAEVRGRVWWYPAYEVLNFASELLSERSVVFTAAPAH